MDTSEITQKILFICEDNASFTVWEGEGDYYGEFEPVYRFGYRVSWNPSNELPCPTTHEIEAVEQADLNTYIQNKADAALVEKYKDNLPIWMFYGQAKASNPSLTFVEFLKTQQDLYGEM